MSARILDDPELEAIEREAWLAARCQGIGGTDVAAIVGVNPYRTAIDVYCDKLGLSEPREETRAMRLGKRLEPVLIAEYSLETGLEALPWQALLRHPTVPWMLGTPDARLVTLPRGLELKTAGGRQAHRWGEPGSDDVPDEYLCQVAWYMAVADMPEWDVAVLIGGQDFRVYHVERDAELEAALIERATDFWHRHIVAQVPPPLDGSPSSRRYIEARFRRNVAPLLQATIDQQDILDELVQARCRRLEAEAVEAELETRVKALIGEAEGIQWPLGRVTWRASKDSTRTDWAAVAAALNPPGDLVAEHTTTRPGSRRFLVTTREE